MVHVAVSGKKKLRIRKYPNMCGQGLRGSLQLEHAFSIPPTATNLALFHILASCQAKILSFSHLKQTLIIKMALTDLSTCHRLPRGGGPRADVGLCKLCIQSSCISPPVGDFLLAMSPVFGKAKHPTGFNYFFLNGT